MPLTVDIWHEVLWYFRYDTANDSRSEMRAKRIDILNIALLSPSLTSIALDVLWMRMDSLEPVAEVINSFASSLEDAYFSIEVNMDFGEFWILERPIEDGAVHSRAQEYLGRVKTFCISDETYPAERHLWPVLATCFGRNGFLLPNLRGLELNFEEVHLGLHTVIHLIPIFSPAITSLVIGSCSDTGVVQMLLRLLKSHGCGLKRIDCAAYFSPDLLLALKTFKDLKNLSVYYEGDTVQQENWFPLSQILKQFTSLTTLRILLEDSLDRGASPVHDSTLESLHLEGDADALQDFLLNQLTSSSLHTLSLEVSEHGNLFWEHICKRAASSFPYLHSVILTSHYNHPLLLQDLLPILSKQLTELRLTFIHQELTTDDLLVMLNILPPNLCTLSIGARYQVPFCASILVPLSQLPHLCNLSLRLDFTFLLCPLPATGFLSKSRLEIFHTHHRKGSLMATEMTMLAQNLVTLFPRLTATGCYSTEDDGTLGSQKIIKQLEYKVSTSVFGRV